MRSATGVRALRVAAGAASAAGLVGALTAVPAAGAGRAAAGPDLVIAEHAPVSGVRPGSSTGMSFAVKNRGDAPATRVVLYLNGSQGLAFAERYTNCAYEDTPAQDEGPAQVNAVCAVGQTLEPGAVYAPEKPVGLHILDRALYERFGVNAQADSPSFPGGTGRAAGPARYCASSSSNRPPIQERSTATTGSACRSPRTAARTSRSPGRGSGERGAPPSRPV